MKAIINATVVMPGYYIPDGTIVVENDVIKAVGKAKDIDTTGCEIIDANGKYVGPGLVDIHTHAAEGSWYYEAPEKCAKYVLSHGVTSVLPALYFDMDKEKLLNGIVALDKAMKTEGCENILGIYMEGPYLNPKFGCCKEDNPWKDKVDSKDYEKIVEAGKDVVKVWCIAPEREGIENFVEDVHKANRDIVFSVAHSEAHPWQIERFIPYGLKCGTHHTNATGTIERYSETRGVCVDECVNHNDEIYAELICDSLGIHVDPYMLRYVEKIKGSDKVILISDVFIGNAPPPPEYEGVTDINFDKSGEIAGSNLTLDVACRNMMVHTGCSVNRAFKYASTNPARMLGLCDRGEIGVGKKANLVFVDEWFNVDKVMLNGNLVK